MIDKNVVIAALARDCERPLKTNIPLIERLRSHFTWSQVVVVENDSVDGTKELLEQWKLNHTGVTIITRDQGGKTIPDKSEQISNPMSSFQRIEKMAAFRNIYLDHIDRIDHAIDILIVIDLDVIELSLPGMLDAINHIDENTGALFANGVTVMKTPFGNSKVYHDVFAVREYPMLDGFGYTPETLVKTLKSINRNIRRDPFYPVISAFGGAGIYNYEAIKGLRHKLVLNPQDEREALCEHIPLNQQIIKRGYKNYISRDFKVIYGKHGLILILKQLLPFKAFNLLYPLLMKLRNRI